MSNLSEMEFKRGIMKLQDKFDKDYSDPVLYEISQEIKETANVTPGEWEAVVDNLLGFCKKLPGKQMFHNSLDYLRNEPTKTKMTSVPCNRCNRLGWVYWTPKENVEQFILDEKEKIVGAQAVKSERKVVVLCGCENSPDPSMKDSENNNRPRNERAAILGRNREKADDSDIKDGRVIYKPWEIRGGHWTAPPWTVKQLIDKNLACIADFERHDGVRLHERPQDTRARKLEELRELYERTGERFIPKPLLEYIKTGKNPPWEKNNKKDVDQVSKDLAKSQAL